MRGHHVTASLQDSPFESDWAARPLCSDDTALAPEAYASKLPGGRFILYRGIDSACLGISSQAGIGSRRPVI